MLKISFMPYLSVFANDFTSLNKINFVRVLFSPAPSFCGAAFLMIEVFLS